MPDTGRVSGQTQIRREVGIVMRPERLAGDVLDVSPGGRLPGCHRDGRDGPLPRRLVVEAAKRGAAVWIEQAPPPVEAEGLGLGRARLREHPGLAERHLARGHLAQARLAENALPDRAGLPGV